MELIQQRLQKLVQWIIQKKQQMKRHIQARLSANAQILAFIRQFINHLTLLSTYIQSAINSLKPQKSEKDKILYEFLYLLLRNQQNNILGWKARIFKAQEYTSVQARSFDLLTAYQSIIKQMLYYQQLLEQLMKIKKAEEQHIKIQRDQQRINQNKIFKKYQQYDENILKAVNSPYAHSSTLKSNQYQKQLEKLREKAKTFDLKYVETRKYRTNTEVENQYRLVNPKYSPAKIQNAYSSFPLKTQDHFQKSTDKKKFYNTLEEESRQEQFLTPRRKLLYQGLLKTNNETTTQKYIEVPNKNPSKPKNQQKSTETPKRFKYLNEQDSQNTVFSEEKKTFFLNELKTPHRKTGKQKHYNYQYFNEDQYERELQNQNKFISQFKHEIPPLFKQKEKSLESLLLESLNTSNQKLIQYDGDPDSLDDEDDLRQTGKFNVLHADGNLTRDTTPQKALNIKKFQSNQRPQIPQLQWQLQTPYSDSQESDVLNLSFGQQ